MPNEANTQPAGSSNAATAQPASATQQAATSQPAGTVNQPGPQDAERIAKLEGSIHALTRKIEELTKAAPATQQANPGQKADEKAWTERLTAAEQELKAMREQARIGTLQGIAGGLNVPEARRKFLVREITERAGERLKGDPTNGYYVEDGMGGQVPLQKYVADFVAGAEGEMFRAASPNASLPRGGQAAQNNSGLPKVTREQLRRGDIPKDGKYQLVD